jgi:hypothetical protein
MFPVRFAVRLDTELLLNGTEVNEGSVKVIPGRKNGISYIHSVVSNHLLR